jgi:uncharacterized protein DUF4328
MTPQPYAPQPYIAHPYQSAHGRARAVVALLIAGAVISLLTIPSHILDMYVTPLGADQELSDNPLALLALLLTAILGLATVAVYIATVITFLMWLYRANNNIAAFGEPREHSAGWAVGSFFVPFANLVIPYRAVKEIWKKSDPAGADSLLYTPSPPGYFPAWWGFWIAMNIANNIYFRMTLADAPADATAIVGIASEVLTIAAAWFAILVVRDIDRRQTERSQTRPHYAGPVPPAPPVFDAGQTASAVHPQTGPVPGATTSNT